MVKSLLINGDMVKPQENNIHKKKMSLLTCPYKNFLSFDIIIWYLKHWRLYIYITDVVCFPLKYSSSIVNFLFFFKCIIIVTVIP